jgi:hypothetical protein
MIEAPGRKADSTDRVTPARAGRSSTTASASARGRSTSTTSTSIRGTRTKCGSTRCCSCTRSTDGGKTFTTVPTPHGDNHGMWFNPTTGHLPAGQRRRRQRHAQRRPSWSSILNQPTPSTTWWRWTSSIPTASTCRSRTTRPDCSERAARVVAHRPRPRRRGSAGVGLRDRPDLAAPRRQGGLGRLQGRSRPLQHLTGQETALLGLPAEPLRPRP